MRSHGDPNFPDPINGGVVHLGADVDPSAPQYEERSAPTRAGTGGATGAVSRTLRVDEGTLGCRRELPKTEAGEFGPCAS
jgi:hypothetical protein